MTDPIPLTLDAVVSFDNENGVHGHLVEIRVAGVTVFEHKSWCVDPDEPFLVSEALEAWRDQNRAVTRHVAMFQTDEVDIGSTMFVGRVGG